MIASKPKAYALFNNSEFSTILYYPSEGSEQFSMITAALQSNPTIAVYQDNDIPTTNKYSVLVEDDYAGSLNILKTGVNSDYLDLLHNSLQNNPTVVYIDLDILPEINTKWSYDGTSLTLIEE